MKLSQLGEPACSPPSKSAGSPRGSRTTPRSSAEGLVVTQDALVEGVHFRLDWLSWRDLGWRAAAVNLSDLAASGAEPEALIVTLGAPQETLLDDILELYEGIGEARVPVRGGDTTRAYHIVLSVTAIGRSERVPVEPAPVPATASSSRGPSAPPAPPFAATPTCVRRSASKRAVHLQSTPTRCSTSRTAWRSTRVTSHGGPACAA